MKKNYVLYFLLGIFCFILVAFFYKGKKNDSPVNKINNSTPKVVQNIDLNQEEKINQLAEEAATCTSNDDCIVSKIKPYCGCYYFFNKNADLTPLQSAIDGYIKANPSCQVQIECTEPPMPEELKCIQNKCNVVRT